MDEPTAMPVMPQNRNKLAFFDVKAYIIHCAGNPLHIAFLITSYIFKYDVLAKHMNALLYPTEGTLWVDGKDTADAANTWDIRLYFFYAPVSSRAVENKMTALNL